MDPNHIRRARRAAAKLGWRVEKSRDRQQHLNNRGGLMLINSNNIAVDGWDYDLTPEQVIERIYKAFPPLRRMNITLDGDRLAAGAAQVGPLAAPPGAVLTN